MKKKQIVSLVVVTAILAALVYLQFRSWQTFDWAKFRQYTSGVSLWHIGAGVALIYLAYVLRAIRWAIFLKPTAPTRFERLVAPQIIGFAALGLFGRAGEFARPYLIARKEKLTFSSQLAVWTVERFFDLGAVLTLMAGFLTLRGDRLTQVLFQAVRQGIQSAVHSASAKLPLVFAALAVAALLLFVLWKASGHAAAALRTRLLAFKEGFNTIHDTKAFVQLVVVSLCMWLMIAGAYIEVLHAYPQIPVTAAGDVTGTEHIARMNTMKLEDVLLVMGSSMLGSVVQLPGGVGGSQLAVIGVLQSNLFSSEPYNITRELAVSCGIMLWLVTFMSVIPAGILLARFEKISFLRISEESAQEEQESEAMAEQTSGPQQHS
jgi:glycosyltransferase 2 family protein